MLKQAFKVNSDFVAPGIQFSFSPQSFLMTYWPLGNNVQTQSNAGQTDTFHSDASPQPGINIVYVPWNISFYSSYGIGKGEGVKIHSFRWQMKFGGVEAKAHETAAQVMKKYGLKLPSSK